MPRGPNAPKRPRPEGGLVSGVASSMEINPAALEMLVMRMMIFPESTSMVPMQYPNSPNTQASNPQNTFEKYTPTWSQTGFVNYPSTHRCAGQQVSDAINQPLQLWNALFDEVTNASIRESKNAVPGGAIGLDLPYSWISPEGTTNFILPVTYAGVTGYAPVTHELKPSCAVFDPSVLTLMNTLPTGTTAANWAFNTLSGWPPGTTNAGCIAGHGLILPHGEFDGHKCMWNDKTAASPPNSTTTPAIATPVAAVSSGQSAAVGLGSAQTISSSCHVIATGDLLTNLPGYQQWALGDVLAVDLYQFNEDDSDEPTFSFQTAVNASMPNPLPANYPLLYVPTPTSDYWYYIVSVTSAGAPSQPGGGNPFTANLNIKRSIRIGQTTCGGYMGHNMVPAINTPSLVGLWSATRMLASSLNAENWTSYFALGAKVVFRQAEIGTFWQAQGIDQNLPGGPYQFNASQPGEEDDTFKRGERGFLGIAGRERLFWRTNMDITSTNLPTAQFGTQSQGNFNISFSLRDRNYAIQVLVSPGIGMAAQGNGVTGGIQAPQALEITFTNQWEAKTQPGAAQVLARRLPVGTEEIWNRAAARVATMKRAGRSLDANMEYYLASENWQVRKQQGRWLGVGRS